jgi:hypothetical protein
MVYNFKERFARLIESGDKLTTIRAPRKDGKLPKPGETLKLFTGMRTKACRKLGERTCLSVKPITITHILFASPGGVSPGICVFVDGKMLEGAQLQSLGIRDGFEDCSELIQFFLTVHTVPFHGFLIEWYPL